MNSGVCDPSASMKIVSRPEARSIPVRTAEPNVGPYCRGTWTAPRSAQTAAVLSSGVGVSTTRIS